jgi:hypothetical protein
MTKFAGIINPITLSKKKNASEILEYLIKLGVYKFSEHVYDRRSNMTGASFDNRRKEKEFFPGNYEKLKGAAYRISDDLYTELKSHFKKIITSGIEEELFHRKTDFQMELHCFLDENDKKDHIKSTYKKVILCLAKEDKFGLGEYYYLRTEKSQDYYLQQMIINIISGGISHGDSQYLMNYLQNNPIIFYERRPEFLDMWRDFEVEYKFAEYLKDFFMEGEKLYSIQNVKAGINRFPEIFINAYACELFHFCITKHPKVQKGTYSDLYRIFAGQALLKQYRGSKTRFENFIKGEFGYISKLQSNKDKDITQDLEFFKSCEAMFNTLT